MTHHQSDLRLRVRGYIDTFMDNAAGHHMMHLVAFLLVWSRFIAVEHPVAAFSIVTGFDDEGQRTRCRYLPEISGTA